MSKKQTTEKLVEFVVSKKQIIDSLYVGNYLPNRKLWDKGEVILLGRPIKP